MGIHEKGEETKPTSTCAFLIENLLGTAAPAEAPLGPS
jgi:hypothetical protein